MKALHAVNHMSSIALGDRVWKADGMQLLPTPVMSPLMESTARVPDKRSDRSDRSLSSLSGAGDGWQKQSRRAVLPGVNFAFGTTSLPSSSCFTPPRCHVDLGNGKWTHIT